MPQLDVVSPGRFAPRVLRRSLAIFLPAAVLTGCVVLALYYQDLANERALNVQAGKHLVDLHADIITRELKAVESDLLYLANQAILRDFLSGEEADEPQLEQEYVKFCKYRGVYDQIRYLDAEGQERIRINYNEGSPKAVAKDALQPKNKRYYFVQALLLERGRVFVSPFDLNIEHERIEQPLKPVIRFATPVFDASGTKRGVLVLNYLGAVLIRKLAAVAVSFPGTAMLLNNDGHFLRGPMPEDEWGFMLGHDRCFATYYPDEWAKLTATGLGQFRTGHGLFTFRSLAPRTYSPTALPALEYADPDAADAGLRVVSHIPPAVLDGRATQLLGRLLLLYGVVLLLLAALAWYLGHAGVLRRNQEQQLADSEARLRALSSKLITAQEEERRSLSRDLHDELGQVVTAVTLELQRAAQAADPVRKNELIGRALRGADRLLDQIHEISARVRPTLLDDLGLKDAVQSYLSEFEHRTGIVSRAELRFEQQDVPAVVSENLYRILQEALTNVVKHARAAEVHIDLHVTSRHAVLMVRDPGNGFDPAAVDGKRLGLLGMRERAELLGGSFDIEAKPGEGTEVRVRLPLEG
jgi:signal transduction histidine kinase